MMSTQQISVTVTSCNELLQAKGQLKKHLSITSEYYSDVILTTIQNNHNDSLRNWKNQNRLRFFFKGFISPSAQEKWFHEYLSREDDYMFVVRVTNSDIGCMGIRMLEEEWDVYNVILGNMEFSKRGYMSQALHMMCSYALSINLARIVAKVLADNPAIGWYCRNGFRITSTELSYVEVELNLPNFNPCPIISLS